jgi:Domain of unknown function (DUF4261)
MPRLFFTQCAAVLFDAPPPLEQVERALDDWPVAGAQKAAEGDDGWIASGPGFVVELRKGGAVIADVVDRPWPDDPRAAEETPALAAAWRAGQLGIASAPGALARAREQCWAWAEGAAAAARHRAFVRLRKVVPLRDESGALPKDHDPVHELATLTEMAAPLLRLPGAIALFFPGGEALRSREQVEEVLQRKVGVGPPPLELWVNLRALGLGEEGGARWVLADTIGMRQLRLPDHEAIFADGREDPEAVAQMLTNACLLTVAGKGIAAGSTADDARGRRWKASQATGLLSPERPVVRWVPEGGPTPSDAFLARGKAR